MAKVTGKKQVDRLRVVLDEIAMLWEETRGYVEISTLLAVSWTCVHEAKYKLNAKVLDAQNNKAERTRRGA